MKKIILLSFVAAATLSSCKISHQSATTRPIQAPVVAAATADLDVSNQKITFTYEPTAAVRRGGMDNILNTAISLALEKNGNADVLIESQKAIIERQGLFGKTVKRVTVTGYPAKYKNFQNLDKKAVEDAFSTGVYKTSAAKEGGSMGILSIFKK